MMHHPDRIWGARLRRALGSLGLGRAAAGSGATSAAVGRLSVVLLVLLAIAVPVIAQPAGDLMELRRLQQQMQEAAAAQGGTGAKPLVEPPTFAPGEEPLLSGPIDPAQYIIGPGDVLGLTLQGAMHRFDELKVSPEGVVLVPGAGPVAVAGSTLAVSRSRIGEEVAKSYRNVQVIVNLLRLRTFAVTVIGQVSTPGQVEASQADRVSEVITKAGGPLPNASDRAITLIRRDGTRLPCDLLGFWRSGDLQANPHLQDGDIIIVGFRREGVMINGEVNKPGQIEFLDGDSLGGMIRLAGGLTQKATLDTIEIARYAPGSTVPNLSYLFGSGSGAASTRSFGLQARDAIQIRTDPNWDVRHRVEVRGEVRFPGTYIIDEDKTTLSELMTRAGGFTSDASLREATLVRKVDESLKDPEYERLRLVPAADMSRTEYEYFKMRGRQRLGLMAVNFAELFEEGNGDQDVLLRDGDIIMVPLKKTYVTLAGQIALPGNIRYEPGLSIEDYITRSGGYSWKAAKGRTVLIRASTGEWIKRGGGVKIGPGDTIWVPEKPDRDWYGVFKDTLLILSQLATIYLVVKTSTQ
jgi:polysaccharide biosynthesis/export protein